MNRSFKLATAAVTTLAFSACVENKLECAKLAHSIDLADRIMAMEYVQGIADNSAPRDAVRQLRIQNFISSQSLNLRQMERHNCKSLEYVSNGDPGLNQYVNEAFGCLNDKAKSTDPPTCYLKSWTGKKAVEETKK